MAVLSSFMFKWCKEDPVLHVVSGKLCNAFQGSRQTLVLGALVAIVARSHMVINESPFQTLRPLGPRSWLLSMLVNCFFGGQFQKAVEEATRSLEQSSQVKCLASSSSGPISSPSSKRQCGKTRDHGGGGWGWGWGGCFGDLPTRPLSRLLGGRGLQPEASPQ